MMRGGVRGEADVAALASLDADRRRLCVLVWHYHDDDVAGDDAEVTLTLAGLPQDAADPSVEHYRIDETHSNSFSTWKAMGSPQEPTAEQYAQLVAAGQLARLSDESIEALANQEISIRFELPRRGVSLLVVTWASPSL
jgi:xylan 1,4-beta-xylosidase